MFESSVIFNGTQTIYEVDLCLREFESSVIFNGTQTNNEGDASSYRLRVV